MKLSDILHEFGDKKHLDHFFGEQWDADHLSSAIKPHESGAHAGHAAKAYKLLGRPQGKGSVFTVDMNHHAAFGDFMRAAGLRFSEFGESVASEDGTHFYKSKRPGVVMAEQPTTHHMTFFYTHDLLEPKKESVTEAKKKAPVDDTEEGMAEGDKLPARFFIKNADAARYVGTKADPKQQAHARRVYSGLFDADQPKLRKVYAVEADTNKDLFDEMEKFWARVWHFPTVSKRFDQFWKIKKHKLASIYKLISNDGKRVVYWYPADLMQGK